jgi:hypothetical protein
MSDKFFMRNNWWVLIVHILAISQPILAMGAPALSSPSLCSRILGTAHYVDLKIKKIKENRKAYKIIQSWGEIPLSEANLNNGQKIFVSIRGAKSVPFGVLGTLKTAEILDEGVILLVVDEKERWHVIDTAKNEISIRLPLSNSSKELEDLTLISKLNDEYFYGAELNKIDGWMPGEIPNRDQLNQSMRQLSSKTNKESLKKIENVYARISTISGVALLSSVFLWGGTLYARLLGYGVDSFLMQHSSNFYMGLAGMAFIHSSLSASMPQNRNMFLSAVIWGSVAFNVGTEIFGPDWLDMATGIFAAGIYYNLIGLIENRITKHRPSTIKK